MTQLQLFFSTAIVKEVNTDTYLQGYFINLALFAVCMTYKSGCYLYSVKKLINLENLYDLPYNMDIT